MMDQLVERFTAQLEEALAIGNAAEFKPHKSVFRNIYVSGMGGSGIGANFVAEFVRNECKIPMLVGKGYDIPKFVNKFTLAIVSSYSGNTEETLAAFDQLLQTGAKIVCVASGGKVIARAKELGLDYIKVPDNWPSPRACLGYSVVCQLIVLQKMKLISIKTIRQISGAINLINKNSKRIRDNAYRVASLLHGKIPVIYTTDRMESVAVRLRQQINENAKLLCWHHVIPEMNHNELVGWRDNYNNIAVLYLRNKDDFDRNQTRIEINKEIISHYTSTIIEVYSKGKTLIEQALYLVHLGDWITVHLADMRGVDPVEVKVIDFLKGELAKV